MFSCIFQKLDLSPGICNISSLFSPEVGIALSNCFLFLYHLYKKKLPTVNKIPPIKDPTTAPIIIAGLLGCSEDGGVELVLVVFVDEGAGDKGEGSKDVVQI